MKKYNWPSEFWKKDMLLTRKKLLKNGAKVVSIDLAVSNLWEYLSRKG